MGRCLVGIVLLCNAQLGAQKVEQHFPDTTAVKGWTVLGEIAGTPVGRTIRSPWMSRHLDTLYATANLFPVDGGKIGRRACRSAYLDGSLRSGKVANAFPDQTD